MDGKGLSTLTIFCWNKHFLIHVKQVTVASCHRSADSLQIQWTRQNHLGISILISLFAEISCLIQGLCGGIMKLYVRCMIWEFKMFHYNEYLRRVISWMKKTSKDSTILKIFAYLKCRFTKRRGERPSRLLGHSSSYDSNGQNWPKSKPKANSFF